MILMIWKGQFHAVAVEIIITITPARAAKETKMEIDIRGLMIQAVGQT